MSELSTAKAVSIWSYEGRTSRIGYFFVLLVTTPLGAIAALMMVKEGALGFFSSLIFAVLLWVSVCAFARRLHDVGHSGWWSLFALVPGVNILFGIYALVAPGQDHDNDYGPSPSRLSKHGTSTPEPLASQAQFQPPALTPVIGNTDVITQDFAAQEATEAEPMEEFWAQALQESESGTMNAGLWAKAFADAGGDERVAKAIYIRLRASKLQDQYVKHHQALNLFRHQELQAEEQRLKAQEAEDAELLAKMTEAKRAEALLPKGKCPACDHVIPLASEQCPKCTALFTADSNWKIIPLSRHEAIAQQAADASVLYETRTEEEKQRDIVRQLIILGVLLIICAVVIMNAS